MRLIDAHEMLGGHVPRFLIPPLAKWLAFDWFNEGYEVLRKTHQEQGGSFLTLMLEYLELEYSVGEGQLERIPETGPVIVVSNHPFGMGDAAILGHLLKSWRKDTRMIGNSLLMRVPELREILIAVNPFGGESATRQNVGGMRGALAHLENGGLVGMFPSGEVAHLSLAERRVRESRWSKHVMKLATKSGARVVPVFIEGHNSPTFQLTGLIHPVFRTAQLPREFRKLIGRKISVLIGKPIPARKIPNSSLEKGAEFLRQQVQLLGATYREQQWQTTREGKRLSPADLEPLVAAVDPEKMAEEVAGLSDDQILVRKGDWICYRAATTQVPCILREIGRLREKTFRTVGEGTGNSIDLDEFDEWYDHMFLWNPKTKMIGGAYRLAPSDTTIAEHGISGLYCRSLFRFNHEFFEQLGAPMVEFGRSFVVEECQKGYHSLALLLLGIGAIFKREPHRRYALGAVSISNNYLTVSRNLMVQFLKRRAHATKFAHLVKPESIPVEKETSSKTREALETVAEGLETIEHINAAVGSIEHDGKGVPVLLRQYMKFNATYLGFNVDSKFSGVLDGLMIIDMTNVPLRVGNRLFGEGVVETVREYHGIED